MSELSAFIRDAREAIVAAWLLQVEKLPSAVKQRRVVLRDHIPDLLQALADALDLGAKAESNLEVDRLASEHAKLRFHAGYDLRQVVLEYQVLRQTILRMYASAHPDAISVDTLSALDLRLDEAIGDAVQRYMAERDRARDVFVGILGHDLGSPLQAIINAAGFLATPGGRSPAALDRIGATLTRSAYRMKDLIRDLLDFARGHLGGGIPISPRQVDMLELVRSAVEEAVASHPDRSITCAPPVASHRYDGEWDDARIAQALSNLINNAIVHGTDPVIVTVFDEGELVRVQVQNGGEIEDSARAKLFLPFHGGTSGSGLGLGLYVVDEIVRAHGGSVMVESFDGVTTMAMLLPRALAGEPRA